VTLLLGVVIGIALIGAVRYVAQEPVQGVHYHANWAIFIDGERLDLTGGRYMEDVFQCMVDASQQNPEGRVHMHESNQDVVHVHAAGVTWGHLIANLGFGVGDDYLYTDSGRFDRSAEKSLKFVLNGTPVPTIRNLGIGNQDRLAISYGGETIEEVVASQYTQVGSDAGRYNEMPDPASCSGAVEESRGDRIRRAFWF
jgi:hypothetical protein